MSGSSCGEEREGGGEVRGVSCEGLDLTEERMAGAFEGVEDADGLGNGESGGDGEWSGSVGEHVHSLREGAEGGGVDERNERMGGSGRSERKSTSDGKGGGVGVWRNQPVEEAYECREEVYEADICDGECEVDVPDVRNKTALILGLGVERECLLDSARHVENCSEGEERVVDGGVLRGVEEGEEDVDGPKRLRGENGEGGRVSATEVERLV